MNLYIKHDWLTLPELVIDHLWQSAGLSEEGVGGSSQLEAIHSFANATVAEVIARMPCTLLWRLITAADLPAEGQSILAWIESENGGYAVVGKMQGGAFYPDGSEEHTKIPSFYMPVPKTPVVLGVAK